MNKYFKTSLQNVFKKGILVIESNIINRMKSKRQSITNIIIYANRGGASKTKAMYMNGSINNRVKPIHHVVDVRLPVANISVIKGVERTPIIEINRVNCTNSSAYNGYSPNHKCNISELRIIIGSPNISMM